MLGQINSSQITKTITWVFIRVNPLGQKLAIFLSSRLSSLACWSPSAFSAMFFQAAAGFSLEGQFPKIRTYGILIYYYYRPMDMQGG